MKLFRKPHQLAVSRQSKETSQSFVSSPTFVPNHGDGYKLGRSGLICAYLCVNILQGGSSSKVVQALCEKLNCSAGRQQGSFCAKHKRRKLPIQWRSAQPFKKSRQSLLHRLPARLSPVKTSKQTSKFRDGQCCRQVTDIWTPTVRWEQKQAEQRKTAVTSRRRTSPVDLVDLVRTLEVYCDGKRTALLADFTLTSKYTCSRVPWPLPPPPLPPPADAFTSVLQQRSH